MIQGYLNKLFTPLEPLVGMLMCVDGPKHGTYLNRNGIFTQRKKLRPLLQGKAIRKLWNAPSPRLQYYMRDVNPMVSYEEQEYLRAPISMALRQMIARYRLSSHHLEVEEGRWKGIRRQDRVCRLCDSGSIENEYHIFIACRYYEEFRVGHQVLVNNLHDLFRLPPKQLGYYIMAVDRKRFESIRP